MPKIAELHDGTQIHFPDHVSDPEIDSAVQRHLGIQPQQQVMEPQMDIGTILPMIMGLFTKNIQEKQAQEQQERQMQQEQMASQAEQKIQDREADHELVMQSVTLLNRNIGKALEPLSALSANNDRIEALIGAVEHLSHIIVECTGLIVDSQKLPWNIVVDGDDKPKGLRRGK